jgi:pyruvate,orthophosphate dikinase
MPGMMDTVLNIGLNDETVRGLIARSGNERFAYDKLPPPAADVRRRG